MPNIQPGVGDVHVRKLLTNISVQYKNDNYIADRIAPPVPVDKQADLIPVYTKEYWARSVAEELAYMQAPPVGGYEVETDSYMCRMYGIADAIPDEQNENQDLPFNAARDASEWVTDQLMLKREIDFLTNFWTTGVWGTDAVGDGGGADDFVKWSDYTTSTPLADLRGYARTIRHNTMGRNPNVLVLGDLTFDVLADHPDVMETIKYSASAESPARVTPNLLAQLLGLDEVLIGTVVYTTTPEGGDATYTNGYGDDALLVYRENAPSLRRPSALYTFFWTSVLGTNQYIRQRRDPNSDRGWLIEAMSYWHIKGLSSDAGVFMSDAVD
ncbi:MAG: hypothetical protein GVY30_00160 [Chloroflexi bacterium]|jgi:hypothetical protein|nr:hypothetical protein [Chloroflexota bacterium]